MINIKSFLKIKRSNNLVFFVTNSFGELDYLGPFICMINKYADYKIKLIFINSGIFKQFKNCKYFKKLFLILKVKCKSIIFSYNSSDKSHYNLFLKKINKLKNFLFFILSFFEITFYYLKNDIIFIESSNYTKSHLLISFLNKFIKKNIIFFPHTSGRFYTNPGIKKNNILNDVSVLISSQLEINYYKPAGFKNFIMTDYPLNNTYWHQLVNKNFIPPYNQKEYVCIFMNGLKLNQENENKRFQDLLALAIEATKTIDNNVFVILKKHPREFRKKEESIIIQKTLEKYNFFNIKFSDFPNFILSRFSKYNLILDNTTIFASYAANKNSYYLFSQKDYKLNNVKKYNLPVVRSKIELINKLKKLNINKISY
jgi:hypothetical protein